MIFKKIRNVLFEIMTLYIEDVLLVVAILYDFVKEEEIKKVYEMSGPR